MPSGSSAEAASSFHDILPSNRIGSAPPPTDEKKASQQQRDKNLADVVETVMPKVQGVVQNIRRDDVEAREGQELAGVPGGQEKRGRVPAAGWRGQQAWVRRSRAGRSKGSPKGAGGQEVAPAEASRARRGALRRSRAPRSRAVPFDTPLRPMSLPLQPASAFSHSTIGRTLPPLMPP